MTIDKIKELRKRMIEHKVVNNAAVVQLSAHELNELLDIAEDHIQTRSFWSDAFHRGE